MECKCNRKHNKICFGNWINRYIMECKWAWSCWAEYYWRELIDTLWNVNYIRKLADGINVLELIDTLWNVNEAFTNFVTVTLPN